MNESRFKIIEELDNLNKFKELSINEIDNIIDNFKSIEIKHYLTALKIGTKPESASAELLKRISEIVLQSNGFSEVKIKGGFIDFAIQENIVNPILIELKPAFDKKLDKNKRILGITSKPLLFNNYKGQIQKYLTGNDFVILTNLNDSYLFNRDAIINYKPFYSIKFTELLRSFIESDCLWDTVRKFEDVYTKPELETQFFIDLNNWVEEFKQVKFIEKDGFTKNELIILFINKIIFIKTLEDYGLIPYKFISDEYFQKYEKWKIKGIYKILDNFFIEFE
ncbi:MAG: hypothetical protein HY738_10455, partial [Bacteroidia bacterium]|nr:hypothetical protein [Bacteroidia bacterium]